MKKERLSIRISPELKARISLLRRKTGISSETRLIEHALSDGLNSLEHSMTLGKLPSEEEIGAWIKKNGLLRLGLIIGRIPDNKKEELLDGIRR